MLSRLSRSVMRNAVRVRAMPVVSSFTTKSMFVIPARSFSVDIDSDNAFKAIKKGGDKPGLSAELEEQLREAVNSSKIVLFMKGVPSAPQCGFSNRVVQILTHLSTFFYYTCVFFVEISAYSNIIPESCIHLTLPFCFSIFFFLLLTDVPYEACNVLESPELREGIKVFSDWPTIPQLYVNGEFVGGCDIITNMFTSGELHELLGLKKDE